MAGYGSGSPYPESDDSIRQPGAARTRVIVFRALTADKVAISLPGRLMGYCMRETTGSAGAVIELFDGQNNSGQYFLSQGLSNGLSQTITLAHNGLDIENGIFIHNVTGTADVILYYRADIGFN